MTTIEALTALSPVDLNRKHHAIATGVLEYAAETVDHEPERAMRLLILGNKLRGDAHEIDRGESASPEMDALLIAASYTDGDDYPALYRVHDVADEIVGR